MINFNDLKMMTTTGILTMLLISQSTFATQTNSPPPTGGDGSGGGSTIGDQLSEDALPALSMKGTKQIPVAELESLVAPYLANIDGKLPGFAKDLRKGLTDIKWYTDNKPFNPVACQDESMFDIHQTIRACQDEDSIRINEAFYRAHPKILADIVTHELVVHYLQVFPVGNKVMKVSKAVRNLNASAEDLNQALAAGGFVKYLTVSQLASIQKNIRDKACYINSSNATNVQILSLHHALADALAQLEFEGRADKTVAQDLGEDLNQIGAEIEHAAALGVETEMSDAVSSIQRKYGCSNDAVSNYPPQVQGSGEKAKASFSSTGSAEQPSANSESAK